MDWIALIIKILIFLAIFAISSFPLYLAVKAMKGKTTLLEVMIVNLISSIIIAVLNNFFFIWGGIISFLLVIILYRAVFVLSWGRAIGAWLLQFLMVALLIAIVLTIEFMLGMTMFI